MKAGEIWIEKNDNFEFMIDRLMETNVVVLENGENLNDIKDIKEFIERRKHKEDVVFGHWVADEDNDDGCQTTFLRTEFVKMFRKK